MSASSWACQQALYALLSGSAALQALIATRIYDDAPQDVAFPWLEIGDRQIVPDDTSAEAGDDNSPPALGDAGVSDFFDLHIWSRYAGKKEADEIADVLHTLLHGASLAVSGRASAHAWVRTVRQFRDPDGQTRHGIVTVEIVHRS